MLKVKSVRDMGTHGMFTLRSPIGQLFDEVEDRFSYGANHGRTARLGREIGHDIIVSTVRKVIPGDTGKVLGGLCAAPLIAAAELVSGIHNVLIKKDDWLMQMEKKHGGPIKDWSEL